MAVAEVRKALVAVGAAVAVAVVVLKDGSLSVQDGIEVVLAALGALGVYVVPNVAKPEVDKVYVQGKNYN